MRKWGNGKQTADTLLLQSSKESGCPMYALTERPPLPDSWGQRALHHSLQANSIHFWQLVSHFLKFVESMNCPYSTLFQIYTGSYFEASSCTCLHALLWIYIYLSHIQHYY